MFPGETDDDADREPPDVLRPLGYVEDRPVARRVVDGLYVGNRHAADPGVGARVRHVLSLTDEKRDRTTHHRPLGDALGAVQRARPIAMPHPALHERAVVYLAARDR